MGHTRYCYVGPEEIQRAALHQPTGTLISSAGMLWDWLMLAGVRLRDSDSLTATFVIDREGQLRVASRHSEHVACAGGEPVLSAGEMTFARDGTRIVVEEVTNQSTGYCPEPESWPAVAAALAQAGLPAPTGFTREFHFRRCPACMAINILKEEIFECALCAADLPTEWNLNSDDLPPS